MEEHQDLDEKAWERRSDRCAGGIDITVIGRGATTSFFAGGGATRRVLKLFLCITIATVALTDDLVPDCGAVEDSDPVTGGKKDIGKVMSERSE